MKRLLSFLAALCLLAPAFAQRETVSDGELSWDEPLPGWETEVRDRIDLMGNIEWSTEAPMPKCFHTKDAMFEAGEVRRGIPYSAVHDFCGYVGKDISFYTFMSAVNNKYSSMYKVNYHLQPYDREKAGPFYGTVCTASANYAMGIPMMHFCRFIRNSEVPLYEDVGNDIDAIHLYDCVCYGGSAGHIIVICGIGRDKDGRVQKVRTFEGTGPVNRIKLLSREDFLQRTVVKHDAHFFRYDHEKWGKIISLPSYVEQKPGIDFKFNTDLSPEDGERLTYPEGKTIVIDILSDSYRELEVRRGQTLHCTRPCSGQGIIELSDLPEGLYTACLTKGKKKSKPIEFQVAQRSCIAWYEEGQLYVGGCRDGVYPIGAYMAPGDKVNKNYSSYPIGHICVRVAEDKWRVEPNIVPGTVKTLKVNLAGRYSGYWADIIKLKPEDTALVWDKPEPGWETEARDRLETMAGITFTTKAPMPKTFHVREAMFEAGEKVVGVPYSSVQIFAGLVGKDISFHTFLSAVNNPRSNMYRVNYHKQPYDLLKAGPYYGLVCNVTMAYVMGIPLVMRAKHIREGDSQYLDDAGNDIDKARLFDGFGYGGKGAHVIIICGLGRDKSGKVREIKIFEGTGPCNRFKTYTREEFQQKMIEGKDGHFYRFDHTKWAGKIRLPEFLEQKPGTVWEFNEELSPEEGELLTYPEGKTVRIDILADGYKTLELMRDGKPCSSEPLDGKDLVELKELPQGLYSACLKNGKKTSKPVEFQVAGKTCRAWYENGQLYIGGCSGAVPTAAHYTAPGSKTTEYSAGLLHSRICVPDGEGRWRVEPNIPEGTTDTLRVILSGKYSSFWAEPVSL